MSELIMNKVIGIYGASGFGSEILPLVRDQYPDVDLCFIDDGLTINTYCGVPVYSYQSFLTLVQPDKSLVIAIANSLIRKALIEKISQDDLKILSVKSSTSVILDNVTLGDGGILCHFTHLTSNIKIGKQFQANIYSYIAHDCVIGDYVTFAPRVHCNGNVHIEDHAYIGTGAILKQGTPDKPLVIGRGAVVGMGAVVTKDVAPNTVVIGNPAKILERK
jgi:sugar O-acyltransferase (sialic acid O-acetyltransferase NeuD family)